jgi:hypothetical protein
MKLLLPILAVAPCAAHRLRSMSSPADDGAWWAEHDGDIIQAEHRHLQSDVTHFQLKMYWEEGKQHTYCLTGDSASRNLSHDGHGIMGPCRVVINLGITSVSYIFHNTLT